MKRKYLIILAAIFALAFLVRAELFAFGDFYFFQDQSRDLLLAKDIIQNHHAILIGARTGFGGLFHGPLWIYSLIPSFIFSQGNPYWSLVPIFMIVSLGVVIAGYFVGKKLYGNLVGILLALFFAISLPLNQLIYFTTNAHVMPLIFLIYLFFIIKYLRGSEGSLIAAFFAMGIGIDFEAAFAATLIPITIMAMVIRRKNNLKTVGLGILALIITLSNYIIFELRHSFLMTHSFMKLITGRGDPIKGYEQFSHLSFRVVDRIETLFKSFSYPVFDQGLFLRITIFLIIGIAIYMVYKSWQKKRKLTQENKEMLFILLIPVVVLILYLGYKYPLWDYYTVSLTIPIALLLSISIKNVIRGKVGLVLTSVLIFFSVTPVIQSVYSYYSLNSDHKLASDSSYKNQLDVAKWILDDSNGAAFNYLVFIPSTLTYSMDYLFTWEKLVGDRKITPCSKTGLTYVIYYPPLSGDNGAHAFWKKNVIKTNVTPIKSKEFAGRINVEKLMPEQNEEPIDPNYCQSLIFR